MTAKKGTPKDFAPHLLVVLAELVEYKANLTVDMKDTYAPVCQRMGIDEDLEGKSGHGTPFTHRQIGLAFRQQLRKKGLGDNGGRGQWMLTEEGIAQARAASSLAVVPGPVTPKVVDDLDFDLEALLQTVGEDEEEPEVISPQIITPEPKPPPPKKVEKVVQLPVVQQGHPYSDDPYILELGAQTTACFGHWSEDQTICADCPLRTDCQSQHEAVLGNLGAQLFQEEDPNHDPEKSSEEDSIEDMLQVYADEDIARPAQFKPAPGVTFDRAVVDTPAMCTHCKVLIERNSDAWWAHGSGYFHIHCLDDSDQ